MDDIFYRRVQSAVIRINIHKLDFWLASVVMRRSLDAYVQQITTQVGLRCPHDFVKITHQQWGKCCWCCPSLIPPQPVHVDAAGDAKPMEFGHVHKAKYKILQCTLS